MSILSDALSKRITWSTAAQQLGDWVAKIIGPNASAQAAAQGGALLTDLKQAASDAIALADTALGPLLATGAQAVEVAADAAIAAALGPAAPILTPVVDAGLMQAEKALVAAIHTRFLAARASLAQHPS